MFCALFISIVEHLLTQNQTILKLPLILNQTLSRLSLIWKRALLIQMFLNLLIIKLIHQNNFSINGKYKVRDTLINWVRRQTSTDGFTLINYRKNNQSWCWMNSIKVSLGLWNGWCVPRNQETVEARGHKVM